MDSAEVMWVCPLYAHCDWPLSTSGLAIGVPSRLWNVAQCQLNACREVAFKQRRRHLPKAILIQLSMMEAEAAIQADFDEEQRSDTDATVHESEAESAGDNDEMH